MTEVAHFSQNVVLMEAAFIREVLDITHAYLQKKGKECPVLDFAHWLSILSIDGGFTSEIEERKKFEEIQIIIVCDQKEEPITSCYPHNLSEIDGMGTMTMSGPMHFSVVQTEGYFSRKELFFDLMDWVVTAPEVKRVMLLPSMDTEDDMPQALLETRQRMKLDEDACMGNVTWVHMGKIDDERFCNHVSVFFSIMMALGIKSEELG